ncbi:inosine-uridine preferring nucleoside hydrolase family protein [Collimonas arenae]|uniref:Inosine-uridine preferring nucleoside hydrolase family protein n=1 Tax=Collimonas arenae TaxID=279058 RepID=A0A127QP48_9BURK|nr:nucleoside hydrolase [Collimonas arenae]AMP01982.1 inosine-uridine preferring nucleoside hydrolase family protein [Collimonas arenae]AMP11878.1 inosine-uridine preferring nucleoside hydrolase family protein [Collimonas arenae]
MKKLLAFLACALCLAGCHGGLSSASHAKIIIDSDYNTIDDDGQLGAMAAQLHAQGAVDVLGITVVSGRQWLQQGSADALKSMERLGVGAQIGVYSGANTPLTHDLETVRSELAKFPEPHAQLGAWETPEPMFASDLKAPPDGFAQHTTLRRKSAVDFIVDSVKQNPHQVTILAVGPLTNIALAVLQHPEIVPLIKQIIYLGGAFKVAGNATAHAEFNWWFDPEAAQIVLHQPIPQVVIPLDAANTVVMDKKIYDRIAHDPNKHTAVTQLFAQLEGYGFHHNSGFETDRNFTAHVMDSLTIAYLLDPRFATETVDEWVDVDIAFGPDDGRSIAYLKTPPTHLGLKKMRVVKRFDNARFFNLYVDLLTRPVPVKLSG